MSDDLIFADENEITKKIENDSWKILIVDDEEEIHRVTKMVLKDFSFNKK